MVHLVVGSVLALGIVTFGKDTSLIAIAGILLAGLLISEIVRRGHKPPLVMWFLRRMERPGVRPGKGTINFFLGAFIALIFFDAQTVFLSVLILAFLDSFSTVGGLAFGRRKVYGKKTLEGSAIGFMAAFFVVGPYMNPFIAAAACLAATLTELFCPIDDNIAIPIVSAVTIAAMGAIL